MPHELLQASRDWPVAPSYTNGGSDLDVLLSHASDTPVRFVVTDDDTAPVIDAAKGAPILSHRPLAMTLKANERLWLTWPGTSTLDVLLLT